MNKVLIIEDEQSLVKALSAKFKKEGWETKTTPNGVDVHNILTTYTPDIILLDLKMPKLNGIDTLKNLKSHVTFKNIPVVIISNSGQPKDKTISLELGAMAYIVKSEMSILDIVNYVTGLVAK